MEQTKGERLVKGRKNSKEFSKSFVEVHIDYEEIDKETGRLCETVKASFAWNRAGQSAKGTFKYNTIKGEEVNMLDLIEGEATFSTVEYAPYRGYVQRGTFEKINVFDKAKGKEKPSRVLRKGTLTFPSGETWEGEFTKYVFGEKRTFVFSGKVKDVKGNMMEGTWKGLDDGNSYSLIYKM